MKKLKPEQLRNQCDPSVFPFKTTQDFILEYEPVHQERAVKALEFGLDIKSDGYNIFVCGDTGTGRNTQVNNQVNAIAAKEKTPDDWLYVYNFISSDEPIAISVPAGRGIMFKKDMEDLVEELKVEIPRAFESEDYEVRKQGLLKDYKSKRDAVLEEVENQAYQEGFMLKQSATGVILVPRKEDRPMTAEEFEALDESEKQRIEKNKHELHIRIEQVLTEVRSMEKSVKLKIKALEKEVTLFSVKHIINELRFKYREFEDIVEHLNHIQEDVVDNIDMFKPDAQQEGNVLLGLRNNNNTENVFKKYEVNLLVDHRHSKGAPVIREANPTYYNLLGRIEYAAKLGSMTTDFTMIASGALHKANGGYLVLQAMDVLSSFMAWETIKRVIKNHEIKVEDINEQFRLISTTSLKPRPIPSDIKIVMVGPPRLYQILYRFDEDFRKMFKIHADFSSEMDRNDEMLKKYAAFIKVRCEEEGLRHFERQAVSRIIEYGSRLCSEKEKLSAHFMYIADIIRESDFWAAKDNSEYVAVAHIEKAINEKLYRSNLIEEKIAELIHNNVIMIDVTGKVTGQVNGLAVYDMGEYSFGKPSRITARTFMGRKGFVDIERQVNMGGNIHSKGVMILNGFFGERFAQDAPLSLNASICFEQSYSGVDGDSASSTEAYCLLSSLADVPINQGIAVTGSMNQHGRIQPVGGINEKIEGFFHVCKLKGLNGKQGVIIPELNIKNLMLKDEIVKAVGKKRFHIWAVSTVDEGIEVLTGKKAGVKNKKGKYPKGTINYLVHTKLEEYTRKFARQKKETLRKKTGSTAAKTKAVGKKN
jgi:lon-related putative ATP-dependent protease